MVSKPHCIPQLEVPTHAEQHQVTFQLCCSSKLGGHQQAARAVKVDIGRVAEQKPLQSSRGKGQLRNLLASRFPGWTWIDQQTTVRVSCDGQSTVASRSERIAVPTWHRQAAFAVERELGCALKHKKVGCRALSER